MQTITVLEDSFSDTAVREAAIRYYENYVEPDMVLTSDEFLSICKEIGII